MLERKKYEKGKEAYRNKEWLRHWYFDRGYDCELIAYMCSVSKMTIYRWLRWHGFKPRSVSEAMKIEKMDVEKYKEIYGAGD